MQRVKSYRYGEDITENTIVKFQDENTVVKCTSALDVPCGVTLFGGMQGAMGDVVRAGEVLINTSEAVSAGDLLMANDEAKGCVFNLNSDEFKNSSASALVGYTIGQVEESATSAAKLWAHINITPIKVK